MIKNIEEKFSQGRQYRAMVLNADDEEKQIVKGYATTFNQPYMLWEDRYGNEVYKVYEQVDKDAFAECDMSDVIMQYDHEGRVFARISNGTLSVKPDSNGLYIEADLSGTEIGRNLFEEIRGGYTNKMSFGFTVAEDERVRTENNADGITTYTIVRTIKKISKLYDVSAVSIPANDATSISARSFGEGVIAEAKEEFRKLEEQKKEAEKLKLKIQMRLRLGEN